MIHAMKIRTTALDSQMGEYSGICVALNGLFEEGKWHLPGRSDKFFLRKNL